jgi:hypothetical protein
VPLTDLRATLADAVARDHSISRMSRDWLQLAGTLAEVAREATAGRVTVVKTRPGLQVHGVAHADLVRALVAMSGWLWSVDPAEPASRQRPLLQLRTPDEQRRALAAYGVLAHELGHVLCTLPVVVEMLSKDGFSSEHAMLEEPRMEASMGRLNPWYRGCYGYAFTEFRLRDLADAVRSRDRLALVDITLRTLGAEHGGLLHRDVALSCRSALSGAVEPRLFGGLDALCCDLVPLADADVDGMRDCCERLRRLLEDEGLQAADGGAAGETSADEEAGGSERGSGRKPGAVTGKAASPDAQRLTAAQVQAIHDAQQAIEPSDWPPARAALERHAAARGAVARRVSSRDADRESTRRAQQTSTAGIAGSPFDPVAAWRAPTAEEEAIARDLARRLSLVPVANDRRMLQRYPPGAVDAVQMVHREAQLARGLAPSAEPFARMERSVDRLRDPRIVVLLDTSGSMGSWIELATGIGWAVARAAVLLRGRVAMVGFGNQVSPIIDPASPPRLVPVVESDGGTMFVRQAWERATERLNMRDPHAPRLLVVVSDGDWHYPDEDRNLLEPYLRSGVAALTIAAGCEPTGSVGVPVAIERPLQLGRVVTDVFRELVLAQRSGRRPRVRGAVSRHA